ncbi:MAG: S8 family peptidase [Flavobacteriales bacterium]|nr:S8 family peptidase [Flavobacteriales bacterium]MDW8410425.1 S8 family serine peptidase [Flavobacteriales bacterium]
MSTLVLERLVVEVDSLYALSYHPFNKPPVPELEGFPSRALSARLWLVGIGHPNERESLIIRLKNSPVISYVGEVHRDTGGTVWYVLPEFFVMPTERCDVSALMNEAHQKGIAFYRRDPEDGLLYFRFSKHSLISPAAWAQELRNRPEIAWAEPNLGFHPIVAVNDPLFPYQWALRNTGSPQQGYGTPGADIKAESAWGITTGSPSVKIAILDSGVDTSHPDLKPNLLPGYDATGQGSAGYPNVGPFASDGHGTSCAGLAAAAGNNGQGIVGVAYTSRIVPVKMFYYIDTTLVIPGIIDTTLHEIPFSTTLYMLNAINWARNTAQVDIMSNSWGIPPNLLPFASINPNAVNNAIKNATTLGRGGKGIAMFFSSGNDNDGLIWPASFHSYVISVGASTNKDLKAPYSNYGQYLDFVAPGHQVYSTDFSGAYGYSSGSYISQFSGTSAACPIAAGTAALVLSVRPDFTAEQLRRCLRQSAEKVGGYDYDSTGVDGAWDAYMGYGRLNAFAALILAPQLSDREAENQVLFWLYPNPAKDYLWIRWISSTEASQKWTASLLTLDGRAIASWAGPVEPSNSQQILLPDYLSPGMYWFRLRLEKNRIITKTVILAK